MKKQKSFSIGRKKRTINTLSMGVLSVAAMACVFNLVNTDPFNDGAYADVVNVNVVGQEAETVSVTTSGDISVDAQTSSAGKVTITSAQVTTKTNAQNGYKLFISSTNGEKDLINTENADYRIYSLPNTQPAEGSVTAIPSTMKANTWGYAVSRDIEGAANMLFDSTYINEGDNKTSMWSGVPKNDAGELIQVITSPTGAEGKTIDVYYAFDVNTALPAGEYKGTISYTAVAESGADGASLSPSSVHAGLGEKIKIALPVYSKGDIGGVNVSIGSISLCGDQSTNYAEDGSWMITCVVPDNVLPGTYTVTVDAGGIGETYVLENALTITPITFAEAFNFYGVETVKNNGVDTGYYAMQDMTSDICKKVSLPASSNSYHTSAKLMDSRDNKTYWVTKTVNGECWMTQNLDLNITGTMVNSDDPDIALSSKNSDIGYAKYIEDGTVKIWNHNSGMAPQATNTGTYALRNNSICGVDSSDPGIRYLDNGVGSWADNLTGDDHYMVGNFYQYDTATAGTGCGSYEPQYVTDSICPKGWKLPSSSDYSNLVGSSNYALNSTTVTQAPLYFAEAGYVEAGSLYQDVGVYRTYIPQNNNFWNRVYVFNTNEVSVKEDGRGYGFSVRCLAR